MTRIAPLAKLRTATSGGTIRLRAFASHVSQSRSTCAPARARQADRHREDGEQGTHGKPPGLVGASQPRAASIISRIFAMAWGSPTKTASPIRKCPMFSSATSGSAAMGPTVS